MDELESVAIEACTAGGEYLREAFIDGGRSTTYLDHDVKSSADEESESRMLDVVTDAFPSHEIYAEESGRANGTAAYRWVIDPLDGTNNFVSGLPAFSTIAAVQRSGTTILAVVYVPILDHLYVARRDGGVEFNGANVTADHDRPLRKSTVVSIPGHDVKRDARRWETFTQVDDALRDAAKRRLESWNPGLHWGLLARGRLGAVVCYHPDEEEQVAGELFARESGMAIERRGGWFVATGNRASLEPLVDVVVANGDE